MQTAVQRAGITSRSPERARKHVPAVVPRKPAGQLIWGAPARFPVQHLSDVGRMGGGAPKPRLLAYGREAPPPAPAPKSPDERAERGRSADPA